jgi:hypothetical protein
VEQYGFWMPATVTTRFVESNELGMIHVENQEFQSGVAKRKFVLPTRFGGHWYAWLYEDFFRIQSENPSPAAVNVRPYTALLLAAFIKNAVPVWLWVEKPEIERRRKERAAIRDLATGARLTEDENDDDYRLFFLHHVRSDDHALEQLIILSKGCA